MSFPQLKPQEWALFLTPLVVIVGAALLTAGRSHLHQLAKPRPTPIPFVLRPVKAVAFSPDSQKLAAVNENSSFMVWDMSDGALLQKFNPKDQGNATVVFSPDGKLLAGSSGSSLFLWSQPTGQLLKTLNLKHLPDPKQQIHSLAFSPDGQWLVAGSGTGYTYRGKESGGISIWRIETGQVQRVLAQDISRAESVVFSPDGQWLAASCEPSRPPSNKTANLALLKNSVRLWNFKTGKMQWEAKVSYDSGAIAFALGGQRLAVGANYPFLLSTRTGKVASLASWNPNDSSCSHIALSPDGQTLAGDGVATFQGGMYGAPLFWETRTMQLLESKMGSQSDSFTQCLTFSPDGKRLATGDAMGRIKIWNVSDRLRWKQTTEPRTYAVVRPLLTLDSINGKPLPASTPSPQPN